MTEQWCWSLVYSPQPTSFQLISTESNFGISERFKDANIDFVIFGKDLQKKLVFKIIEIPRNKLGEAK